MARFILRRFLVVLAYCIVLGPVFAQGTGTLRGIVTDQSGSLVPDARIRVTSPAGIWSASSGKDGGYSVLGLSPGRYAVHATAPGLTQGDPALVEVTGGVASLDLSLRVVLEKQEITVSEQGSGQVSTDASQNTSSLSVSRTNDSLEANPTGAAPHRPFPECRPVCPKPATSAARPNRPSHFSSALARCFHGPAL